MLYSTSSPSSSIALMYHIKTQHCPYVRDTGSNCPYPFFLPCAAVKCIKSADNGLKKCEGTFCTASYHVHSVHGETWQYDCIDDAFGFGSCINPYVRYEQNHIDMVVYHIFSGCCSSDWCSNDTEALTMPVEYQEYFNSLNPSSPVEPIPSRSVPEHETKLTPSLPPDPFISITWLPSEVSVTTVTVVSQSRGTDAAVSPCDTASTTASTSLVQPSSIPSSGKQLALITARISN